LPLGTERYKQKVQAYVEDERRRWRPMFPEEGIKTD
jgi:hypothetical protein